MIHVNKVSDPQKWPQNWPFYIKIPILTSKNTDETANNNEDAPFNPKINN